MQASDEKNTGKRNLLGMGGDDAMEIDEDSGNGRTTRGTKRGPGGFSFNSSGRR
jgi:COP9 signalosome complex subunit 7